MWQSYDMSYMWHIPCNVTYTMQHVTSHVQCDVCDILWHVNDMDMYATRACHRWRVPVGNTASVSWLEPQHSDLSQACRIVHFGITEAAEEKHGQYTYMFTFTSSVHSACVLIQPKQNPDTRTGSKLLSSTCFSSIQLSCTSHSFSQQNLSQERI